MKKINVFFIAILIIIFNVVLVYSVIGYVLENPMWLFTNDNISKEQGSALTEPLIKDVETILKSSNNHDDAIDSEYNSVFSAEGEFDKDESTNQEESISQDNEKCGSSEDTEKPEVLSESLMNDISYSLDGLLSLGIVSYFDDISLADKLAALAIAGKIGTDNIARIANIVQKGIGDQELDEISKILSECLTEEEMDMLKKMILRYIDKIYEASRVEIERLHKAMR